MYKVKITAMRQVEHSDLMAIFENDIEEPCSVSVGDTFISTDGKMPIGLCESAWESMRPFVMALAKGGGNFYNGWMRDEHTAMISCNDGFRPMSFLLERVE